MKQKAPMQLTAEDHRALMMWAIACAEHVLHHFEDVYPGDDRPRRAIEAGRAWSRGEVRCGVARAAALGAHAAAREAVEEAATAAARSAGHAAATAHAAAHSRAAAMYAVKAVSAAAAASEREWQSRHLAGHLAHHAGLQEGTGRKHPL